MRRSVVVARLLVVALTAWLARSGGAGATTLRFEVTVGPDLLAAPAAGRVLVVLGRAASPEPRRSIGETGTTAPPVLGADATLANGKSVVLDRSSMLFPLANLTELPASEYHVQAVFDHNPDLRLPSAPGNLVSEPVRVRLDPARGGVVSLALSRRLPDEQVPADTAEVKYLRLRSERLSRFHGRPIYLRAGVILPPGHARSPDVFFPLRVAIGGFGTRYTAVRDLMHPFSSFRRTWQAADTPRMILLHLDGAGPLGDPYQVNSANHGPYGDAITEELIPHVERQFRGIGKPYARVLEGASTGGWVSLALQVFYPDFFNGAWSHCPDPVDFRAFELIDIYSDTNAYVNRHGFERPACRSINGDTRYTMRHEVAIERVLGRGERWTLSGRDWGSWNATFSPRGADGLPMPLWDGRTGRIDPAVAEHWRRYDLRRHLETNWARLAGKLHGKLRVWVGEADDYFLNNAVHLLDSWQRSAPKRAFASPSDRAQDHNWRGLSEREMIAEMAAAIERAAARGGRVNRAARCSCFGMHLLSRWVMQVHTASNRTACGLLYWDRRCHPGGDLMQLTSTDVPFRVGVFDTVAEADRAVHDLLTAGFDRNELAVLCSDQHKERHFRGVVQTPAPAGAYTAEGIVTGSAVGAVIGGVMLAASSLVTAGVPILAGGAAMIGGGALAGSFAGAMMTRGLQKEIADYYEQSLELGQILVAVEVHGDNAEQRSTRAAAILRGEGVQPVPLPEG
ncbi:MAG: alpha/beta hydrolase-fold protein [Gemmataceae bacterium]